MARVLLLAALAVLVCGCVRTEAGEARAGATPVARTSVSATTTTTAPSTTSALVSTTVIAPETTTAATSTTETSAPVVELGEYAVVLAGTVAGQAFEREAQLSVTGTIAEADTGNGVNELDVCLVSGFPAGAPEVGAVWFGSNTGCFPSAGAADIDLAYTTVSGTTVTVEADAAVAAAGLNTFVDAAELISCPHFAVEGGMEVAFGAGGTVGGSVAIVGDSGPCRAVGTRASFTAEFSGFRL